MLKCKFEGQKSQVLCFHSGINMSASWHYGVKAKGCLVKVCAIRYLTTSYQLYRLEKCGVGLLNVLRKSLKALVIYIPSWTGNRAGYCKLYGMECRAPGMECRAPDMECRAAGMECRAPGMECRAPRHGVPCPWHGMPCPPAWSAVPPYDWRYLDFR
jgi:hypothetical protein